jgi:hypothetical protein
LIIIDEVDGTHESEYFGAISSLMKHIYSPPKPEGKENRKNPTDAFINSKSKSTVRSLEDGRNFYFLFQVKMTMPRIWMMKEKTVISKVQSLKTFQKRKSGLALKDQLYLFVMIHTLNP